MRPWSSGRRFLNAENSPGHVSGPLLIAAVLFLFSAPCLLSAEPRDKTRFRLIVNAANPARSLTTTETGRLFLKKVDWPTHQPVLPVDLPEDSEVRKSFSSAILGRQVSSLVAYWQFMIFSGRASPPVSVQSDEEVIRYVRLHREAIGYVSASTPLEPGVVEVAIKGDRR
jgi:hypothetical protein